MDSEFAQGWDAFSDHVLAMTNNLLNLVSTVDRQGTAKLENQEDVVDNFHMLIVDPMDQLLGKNGASILSYCGISDEEYRRSFICLDEFLGKNKAPAIVINPPIASNSERSSTKVLY